MAITPLTVTIDLNPSYKKIPAVYVSQLDNNLRSLAITVQDGGVNYDVASSGYDVYVEGTKPDKHGFSYKVTDIGGTVVGSVVTVPMQTQMTCVQGMVPTEIVLKYGADRIGSANFLLVVERAGLAEDVDVSETDIPAYIDGAQQAAAAAEDAKDLAVAAKDTAVAVAASIPADYTTLSNDVDDLKSAFEQLPTSIQPGMTVGSLMSEEYTEEKMPYLYRVAGGGIEVGKVEADQIVGGSIAWNQLFTTDYVNLRQTSQGYDVTVDDTKGTFTINVTDEITQRTDVLVSSNNSAYFVKIPQNHKFVLLDYVQTVATYLDSYTGQHIGINTVYYSASPTGFVYLSVRFPAGTPSGSYTFKPIIFDLTQMFGSTIADYLYSLETATAGAGVAVFRKMFPNAYYPYNAGELMHVSGVSSHDMVGFNLWDEEWEAGIYSDTGVKTTANNYIRSKNYIRVFPNAVYYAQTPVSQIFLCKYDANKNFISRTLRNYTSSASRLFTMSANTHYITFCLGGSIAPVPTYNNDICINLSSDRNGTYEPYKSYTYPLDSSLTLRGIPKLSDGQIYYDGDVYSADGKVQRKYGIVDMGSLTYTKDTAVTGIDRYSVPITGIKNPATPYVLPNVICGKFVTYALSDANQGVSGAVSVFNSTVYFFTATGTYSDASAFKTAMSGVMLVYELATPTTETAEPYAEYQHVTNGGTEEYVSTGIVPVGHNTKYYGDIGAKVDKLPSDFSNIIAPTESAFKATRAYTVNDLIIIDNVLYKVTASIASGATITPNTNVQQTTLSALIKALS